MNVLSNHMTTPVTAMTSVPQTSAQYSLFSM